MPEKPDPGAVRNAAEARDAAAARLRTLTGATIVGTAALTGVVAFVAAGSGSAGNATPSGTRARATTTASRVVAPAPPMVPSGSDSSTPPAASAPTQSAQPPSSASQSAPPVAVTGGS